MKAISPSTVTALILRPTVFDCPMNLNMAAKVPQAQRLGERRLRREFWGQKTYRPPIASSFVRVRNNSIPSEIAGVAMQVSPKSLMAAAEN